MEKQYKHQLFFGVLTLLLLLISFSGATYAWFTFSGDTNVEPLEGGIGYGDGDLLIALSPDGPFSDHCELNALGENTLLRPLSTADLNTFYAAREHDRSGISIRFSREEDISDSAVRGTVYLKSERNANALYLDPNRLDFGSDAQALASLRLGLVITARSGVYTYIFRLDDMGIADDVQARQTIAQPGCVVGSVDADGAPGFVPDPGLALSDFFAAGTEDPDTMSPGRKLLCILSADEVARVDYFLYLEGCDENCFNPVQGRLLALSLGFAGFVTDGEVQ